MISFSKRRVISFVASGVDPVCGQGGVAKCCSKLVVHPGDLRGAFVAINRFNFVQESWPTNSAHLLLTTNRSLIWNLILRTKLMTRRQSAMIGAGGGVPIKGKNEFLDIIWQIFALPEDISGAAEEGVSHPSIVQNCK